MSKATRRRQRPGSQPSTASAGSRPPGPTTPTTSAASTQAPTLGSTPAVRSTTPTTTPVTGARHGRRERARIAYQPSFLERHRTIIVALAAFSGLALIALFVFAAAARPAYACTNIWKPAPTASPAPGATPALGYVQPDQGTSHDEVGTVETYTYCAPASGPHYNKPGIAGPIQPRVYGPDDTVLPQGWIHNLEHGGMVILYRGDSEGATAAGQAQLKALYDAFPAGPVCNTPKGLTGPVIARFDKMSTPFQAIVWGRVLQLESLDQAQILAFWAQWGERTNPEQQCKASSPSPSTVPTTAPTATPAASPS